MLADTHDVIRRSIRLLSEEKGRFYFAVFLCIAGGVVELVGVGTLYPFLALLANSGLIETNDVVRFFYTYGQFRNTNSFLLWSGWIALFFLFFATMFMYLKNAYIIRFCVGQTARVSAGLLDSYLRKPMLFHVESNSGELTKNVLGQSDQFTNQVLLSIMTIMGDGIILIVLIGVVLVVDMRAGLTVVAMLGLILGAALVLIRRRVSELGQKNDEVNGARIAFCIGALQSVKEIKTSGKEEYFGRLFHRHAEEYGRYYAAVSIMQTRPQALLQFVAAGSVIGIALYYIASGVESSKVVPMLAIYAVAGYRLMPSFNRLSLALSQLNQYQTAVSNITNVFEERVAITTRQEPSELNSPIVSSAITFHKVGFAYPKAEHAVFNNLELEIEGNTFVCLVGASGSGKTTLVDLLLGLLLPDKGEIMISGHSIGKTGELKWREMFGYVSQSVYMVDGTIAENIAFGIAEKNVDREKLSRIVKMCHLEDFIDSQPDGLESSVGERGCKLSGGQKQRIGIARALYRDPAILILDESTSSLDGISEKWIIETLGVLKKSKTIITIAHRNSLVRSCDRIVFIERGEIVADGDYSTLCRNSPMFASLMSEMEKQ